MDLILSVFASILIIEAYEWLPAITDWLLARAVSKLLSEHQDRFREEWAANLSALPNSGVKLLHAVSLLICAVDRINADAIEDSLTTFAHELQLISDNHNDGQCPIRC